MANCSYTLDMSIIGNYLANYTGNVCCWEPTSLTYADFLTGITNTYNNSCLEDRQIADYITTLYTSCLSGSSSSSGSTSASTVLVTDNESGNDNNLLVFVGDGATTTGQQSLQMDGDLYYNPSIGKLYVPLTLQMPDGATVKLGDSQDLKLYHDGDDSYIKENGTGDLKIQTNSNVIIEGTGGENCAVFVDEGGVELYYDNTKKFETTTAGVTVVGAISGTTDLYIDNIIHFGSISGGTF